ncbi:transporter associated domain-containing protein [Polycladidibacter stylochi]|uniref:transporter associated domain-containing protein n=1 Tax=Polycladidibacter stylochi TaxID=1807766 RepID=UPI00082E5EA9|nr:hemolysin family protein [Pseudovibrio stylochi]
MNASEPRSTDGSTSSPTTSPVENPDLHETASEEAESSALATKASWGVLSKINPFKIIRKSASASLRADLQDELARDSEGSEAAFSATEKELLTNILQLRESRVEDVMIPRADIIAVEDDAALHRVLSLFQSSGHSRMPVYHDNLDDPRGMVHIKDLMSYFSKEAERVDNNETPKLSEKRKSAKDDSPVSAMDFSCLDLSTPLTATGLIRPLHFVPPSMSSLDLMNKMQVTRVQMALVIDEYGGTDGLVSLEDIVETVVGNIEDEHDKDEEEMITPVGEGIWSVDPRIDLEDLEQQLMTNFKVVEEADEVDTLGGLLFTLLDRVPVRGELICNKKLPAFEFEVVDADPRRIKRLRVYRRRADQRGSATRNRTRRPEAAE